MKIFQLTWNTHDMSKDYYFAAPAGKDFQDFKDTCDRLMREAALDAAEGKPWQCVLYTSGPAWLGYDSLMKEVATRLPGHGYERVQFPTVEYTHGMIIRMPGDDESGVLGPEVTAQVIAYNRRTEEKLDEHRRQRREHSNAGTQEG
jgi:hypothetical protein